MARDWSAILLKNGTSTGSPPPVRDILETFIPGYKGIFTILDQVLGIDISIVISACAIVFTLLKLWRFLQEQAYIFAKATIVSEITFDSDDLIYVWLMEWIQKHPIGGRMLIAKVGKSPDLSWARSAKKETTRAPPEISYAPSMGTHYFWFQHRLYRFSQWKPRDRADPVFTHPGHKNIDASLSCFGRNTEPIRRLLAEAAKEHFEKTSSNTPIFRPYPKTVRQNARGYWTEIVSRPSRSMDTVIFDSEQKKIIVEDMEEYLQEETMTWYAGHGIPYRRGYLFHGPPGTGKSSLCFALAGHFKLPLYCLSLQEPSMTEEDLAALFDALPKSCVAVLEDVDCAGLVVRSSDDKEKDKSGPVSLSGLLNIIDGVASKEGRVLIMTTNRIEVLDSALIRPGRVDLQIEFKLASQHDARRLFDGIYDQKDSIFGKEFGKAIPADAFSAAEIQGFLLARKGKPERALQDIRQWVNDTLRMKEEAKLKDQLAAAEKARKLDQEDQEQGINLKSAPESDAEDDAKTDTAVSKGSGVGFKENAQVRRRGQRVRSKLDSQEQSCQVGIRLPS